MRYGTDTREELFNNEVFHWKTEEIIERFSSVKMMFEVEDYVGFLERHDGLIDEITSSWSAYDKEEYEEEVLALAIFVLWYQLNRVYGEEEKIDFLLQEGYSFIYCVGEVQIGCALWYFCGKR